MKTNRLPLLASSALLASLAQAQSQEDRAQRTPAPVRPAAIIQDDTPAGPTRQGARMPSLRTPIHTAAADLGNTYGTWAAGDDYKASFHDGMTFVPYLGRGYPVTQSLRWQTTSARIGGVELVEQKPAGVGEGYRYEYRFGAITEAYDVLAQGLEQTFVLHQRPAPGDLVIQGAVQSLLRSRNVARGHQALTFVDDQGRAIVEYGRALAFDAAGRQVLVDTTCTDNVIALTVPGDWLAQATLPVTVDPLLARSQIATWGSATDGEVETIDVGRDDEATAANVLVTYTRSASATDSDLWGRLFNDDWTNGNLVFSDITTSWVTDQTSCAFVGGSNRWAIVFRRYFPNNPTRESQIRCHVHASGDTTLLTNYGSLVPPGDLNDWRPDVGGVESFATGNNALVVFQREDNSANGGHFANVALSTVQASLLDTTTANGTFGAPFEPQPSAIHDAERPSVNQVASGGAAFSWLCVFQRFQDGVANEDWDLNGKRIAQDGSVASGLWLSDLATVSPSVHQLGPVVEGQGSRYAVTFTTVDVASVNFKTGLIAGKDLQLERLEWPGNMASPTVDFPTTFLRGNADRRWEATGLGFDTNDDSHFAIGFRAVAPGVPVAYYARVGYRGQATEGPIGTTLYSVANETPTEVACVFDNDHDDFLFAYGVDDNTVAQPVYGHTLEYVAAPALATAGAACTAAALSWTGDRQIGAEYDALRVTGAPAGAAHFVVMSMGTTNVPVIHPAVFPGCRLLVEASGPNYLGLLDLQIGAAASWRLSLPENLDPATFHFQDWLLDGAFLYSTSRLSVGIIK